MLISTEQRFMKHVQKTSTCWIWTATKLKSGYGHFKVNGKTQIAHRISYELYKGPIPKGLFCLHKCDNPSCVCPTHLFLGTPQDNMTDKVLKNRQAHNKGEDAGNSKLNESQVREIRNSTLTQQELADLYNVGQTTVSDIKNRKTWKHIK